MLHDLLDVTLRQAGFWTLFGCVSGFALAVAVWWRPITRNRSEGATLRLLRMSLEDSDKQVTALHQQNDRLARQVADAHAAMAAARRVA